MTSFTVSDVLEYLYCPRYTYFEHVQGIPQHEEMRFKVVKGRDVHKNKAQQDADYLRTRLGVVDKLQNLYLAKDGVPFRGEVDEALILADGHMAPLDYKYAEFKDHIFETYRTQAIIYGYLIHLLYEKPVTKAYLVFVRSQNKLVAFDLTKQDFANLERIASAMETITMQGTLPKATPYKKRCHDCCYANICPK